MEQPPHGGDYTAANSYGTDDPEIQAHIENARIDGARERHAARARLEQLVDDGLTPDEAEAVVEFERSQADQPPAAAGAETQPTYQPRIYVQDLASHHQGLIHGVWLDANQEQAELDAAITSHLRHSPVAGTRSWAVTASQGFAGLDLTGFRDTALISRLGLGVAEHGEAFAAYVQWAGHDTHILDAFADHYRGSYPTLKAWGQHEVEARGWNQQLIDRLDDELLPYVHIDHTTWAHEAAHWWHIIPGRDGLHVFSP